MNEPFPVGCRIKVKKWGQSAAIVCEVVGYETDPLGGLMLLRGHTYLGRMGLSHVSFDCRTANPNLALGTETDW